MSVRPHSWEKQKVSRALHNSTERTSIVCAEVARRPCSTCSILRLPWGRGAHCKAAIKLWRRGAHWRLWWPHVHVLHRLLLRLLEVWRRCIVWRGLQHCWNLQPKETGRIRHALSIPLHAALPGVCTAESIAQWSMLRCSLFGVGSFLQRSATFELGWGWSSESGMPGDSPASPP